MKKLLLGFVLVFATLFTNAWAEDNPRAVIIFDASGSMWGQINGVTKIEIARDALKNVVKEWNPSVELGLTVYGHRSKGDCNDIETVIPVGKIDKNRVIKTVMGIKPKGKTPISRSLRKVAEEIKYTEEKATIILISDGKETCDPDPCGTAKELEAQGIDFVTHVIGFNVDKKTDKQLECIADATGGEYFSAKNATALNEAMKVIAKKVEVVTPPPAPKPVVKKLDHTLEVSASEKEGGKWVDATCRIYNEDKSDSWVISPRKKESSLSTRQLPVGKYTLNCDYNAFERKDIPVEIKAGEITKVHVVMGQTGKVKVSASEKEGGKWIDASCRIYNEDKSDYWAISPRKKESSLSTRQLPVGKYTLNCDYNAFERKDIPVEVKVGETAKVHVVMGQTGKVKVSASEKEGGKWIDASCRIYNEDKSDYWAISPRKKESSLSTGQLPVGKYTLNCDYNAFERKDIPVEVKVGETAKVHVVMGQTGKVKVSASEKEGGKWIDANCRIYNEDKSDYWAISPRKKESSSSVKQLPVGKYTLNCDYNAFERKDIPVEVKVGETAKVHVVMGSTGKVEVSASEKKGGKWIGVVCRAYKVIDGEVDDSDYWGIHPQKKKAGTKQIPVGNYQLKCTYNALNKETPFEIKAGETTKVHVTFGQFFIESKCMNMGEKISYEIYASSGQLVNEKTITCSDTLKVTLDNGDYSVEAKVGNDTKEVKFTVGGSSAKLLIDMTDIKREPTKEELIKADSQDTPVAVEVKKEEPAVEKKVPENKPQVDNSKEIDKTLGQLGALLGGVAAVSNSSDKPLMGLKESLKIAIPSMAETKGCYKIANSVDVVAKCDAMANDGAQKAQDAMNSITGKEQTKITAITHTDWNDDIKHKELTKIDENLKNAKLYLECINKGANMSQLRECAANNGDFTPKKDELKDLGNLLKMFGNK